MAVDLDARVEALLRARKTLTAPSSAACLVEGVVLAVGVGVEAGSVGHSTSVPGTVDTRVSDIPFRRRFRTDDDAGMTVDITAAAIPSQDELASLYDAVGWATYARDSETLHRAMRGSSRVVTARRDGHLIGLARVISDGATIAYLQDIVVRPAEQRRGLGKRLVEEAFAPFDLVRQKVLLTDDEPAQRAFYESLGFAETRDFEDGSLRAFVKFG